MSWITEPAELALIDHRCGFPHGEDLPTALPAHWRCDSCGAVWQAYLEQGWSGFWAPEDHNGEVLSTKPAITIARGERFHVVRPRLHFKHVVGGTIGVKYNYTMSVEYPHLPDPGLLARDGEYREYTDEQRAKMRSQALSRLSPQARRQYETKTTPPVEEPAAEAVPRRKWLLRP